MDSLLPATNPHGDGCWARLADNHEDDVDAVCVDDLVNNFDDPEISEDEANDVVNKVTPHVHDPAEEETSQDCLMSLLASIAQVLGEQCKNALHLHAGLEHHAMAVKWAEDEIVKVLDSKRPASINGQHDHPHEMLHSPPPLPARSSTAEPPTEPPPNLMWQANVPSTSISPVSNGQPVGEHRDEGGMDVNNKNRTEGPEPMKDFCAGFSPPPETCVWNSLNKVPEDAPPEKAPNCDSMVMDFPYNTTETAVPSKNRITSFMDVATVINPIPETPKQRPEAIGELENLAEHPMQTSIIDPPELPSAVSAKDSPAYHTHASTDTLAWKPTETCRTIKSSECFPDALPLAPLPTSRETAITSEALPEASACPYKVGNPTVRNGIFSVLPIWKSSKQHAAVTRVHKRRNDITSSVKRRLSFHKPFIAPFQTREFFEPDVMENQKCSYGLHPYTTHRACWDVTSLVLVVYDMIMIPMQLFEPPSTSVTDFFTWTTRLFWSFDMILSCITGIVTSDGRIELRLHHITKRYLRSWFWLDSLIVGSDWAEFIMRDQLGAGAGTGYARAGKVSRAFRIVRMLRLLRLARMREVLGLILERIRSERLIIVANVAKMTILLMGMAHVVACVWWGIGVARDEGFDTWVHNHAYTRQNLLAQYTMSLHWSLSQFAGGMDEVTPQNNPERCYTISIFLFAFVVASLFVSSLTSSMTQLDIIGSKQSQELSVLRRYLYQNGISSKLALRVQRNAQHAILEQQRLMPEEAVTLLTHVSEPLRMELHFEMFSEPLSFHPWLRVYTFECPQVMRKVCHAGTSISIVSAGDVIFNAGEIPAKPKMYFITSGTLQYESLSGLETEVIQGSYVAEATLWTPWMHRGMLTASSDCRLCVLDSKKFQEIAGNFHHSMVDPMLDPRAYAAEFVRDLNASDDELTDLAACGHHHDQPAASTSGMLGGVPQGVSGFTAKAKKTMGLK